MPDWTRLVAERLAGSKLTPEVQREVVTEIAAHLDEGYGELCDAGCPDAEQPMLEEVADWNALGRRIRRAKEDRMSFARKVAMPGIAAVVVALAALKLSVARVRDQLCFRRCARCVSILPWPCAMNDGL